MSDPILFPEYSPPLALIEDLRRQNPWWEGKPRPALPDTRRHLFGQMRRRIDRRLAPVVVVRGPRQIGKTTAQLQVLSDLLAEGVAPQNILRVQCDDLPELRAIQTRISYLELQVSENEVAALMRKVAGSGFHHNAQHGYPPLW